jgi:hypothetical protein
MRPVTLLAFLALTSPAVAQQFEDLQESQRTPLPGLPDLPLDWEPTPRLNSAGLAASALEHTGTAGLSFPDGRQAVVTFWTAPVAEVMGQAFAFRCVTVFDADLVETSETCEQAVYLRE